MRGINEFKEIKEMENKEEKTLNETSKLVLEKMFADDYDIENETYSDNEIDKLKDEFEFYDEWESSSKEMTLEEYNEMRCIETYSDSSLNEMDELQILDYIDRYD